MSTVEQDVTNLKTDMAELRAIVRELALSQQRTEIELQNFKEFVLTSQAKLGTALGKIGTRTKDGTTRTGKRTTSLATIPTVCI
jgi:hypothetical protein